MSNHECKHCAADHLEEKFEAEARLALAEEQSEALARQAIRSADLEARLAAAEKEIADVTCDGHHEILKGRLAAAEKENHSLSERLFWLETAIRNADDYSPHCPRCQCLRPSDDGDTVCAICGLHWNTNADEGHPPSDCAKLNLPDSALRVRLRAMDSLEKENQELRAKLDGIEEALQDDKIRWVQRIGLALRIIATSTMKEESHD